MLKGGLIKCQLGQKTHVGILYNFVGDCVAKSVALGQKIFLRVQIQYYKQNLNENTTGQCKTYRPRALNQAETGLILSGHQ